MKQIFINISEPLLRRAAVLVDDKIEEFLIEETNAPAYRGCIYLGKIINYERALKAAFVDIGRHRHGFLPLNEIQPELLNERQEPKKNQIVLVQVTREENQQKGAMLSTYISLAGRYMVFMPYPGQNGISRKISDDNERKRLKKIQDKIGKKNTSTILRTASVGCSQTKLAADLAFLKRLWTKIEKIVKSSQAPAMIYEEQDFVTRIIREHFSDDLNDIFIDEAVAFQNCVDYLKCINPKAAKEKVKYYSEAEPLFYRYNIEPQIDELFKEKVLLPHGGSIVIQQTEALVSIDVNSGKTHEANPDITALKTNLEAAAEIVRQLRLRDLGGIIVIDFIDMESSGHQQQVIQALHQALKSDRARTKVGSFSGNGTLEINRQRRNSAVSTSLKQVCPYCEGSGHVLSGQLQAAVVMMKLRSLLAREPEGSARSLLIEAPQLTAFSLLNEQRRAICALEDQYNCVISIKPTGILSSDNLAGININFSKK